MTVAALAPSRPPCSVAEREAARLVADEFRRLSLTPAITEVRSPTSPTWAPLLRALLRVWAAAFMAAGLTTPAVALAVIAVVGGIPALAMLLSRVPLLGGVSENVSVRVAGTAGDTRPIVAIAHIDTHPTDGAPLARWHRFVATASAFLIPVGAYVGRPAIGWRAFAGPVAAEAVLTLAWLARRELTRPTAPPDDNTSGIMALSNLARLAVDVRARRDLWLVATAGGTTGGAGTLAFFREHGDLGAWVIDIDALGSGEVVATPIPPRFPHPGTPTALVRAIVAAARLTGDPVSVRRIRRPHSDARAALRVRAAAITLTAGILHPARARGPDAANAARAARIVHALASTQD